LTFPRIYLPGHPKTFARDPETNKFLHIDIEATEALQNRAMPTEQEIDDILKKADLLETLYFQLRAKAIIGLVKIFGKRRAELGLLEPKDLLIEEGLLYVTFTICKKSKKGFFQYLQFLKKQGDPELLNKPLPILQEECKNWNLTKEGSRLKKYTRQKYTPISDKFAKLVIDYFDYMTENYPSAKFLFPSGKEVFGSGYLISADKALSGRQILSIVKKLDPNVWIHLFRKKKGSEVARRYGRTLESVFMVKDTLDLERLETAMHYVEANAPKMETGET